LFLALWPSSTQQAALAEAVRDCVESSGGRAVPAENLHVTLAFLGSVPEADEPKVVSIAAEVASKIGREPVRVVLDQFEYWKKPRVLCLTTTEQPGGVDVHGAGSAAAVLAEMLKVHLTTAGFTPDLKPFRPHVTLARKAARASRPATTHPVDWSFDDFTLVRSETGPQGSVYTVEHTFPLGSA
jgi:RNA 2',3'-cyclic 3'-phosphodiesterase